MKARRSRLAQAVNQALACLAASSAGVHAACLDGAGQDVACTAPPGKMLDSSQVRREDVPASSERQLNGVDAPSSLSVEEIRSIRDAAASLPASPAQSTARMHDMPERPLFASGEALLEPAARMQLDALAASLAGKADLRIHVRGHTDDQRVGRPETLRHFPDNQALSEARALAVVAYLKARLNLPAQAFSADGRAATEPVADNRGQAGRAPNRRVEIQAWYRDASPAPEPAVERRVTINRDICAGADSSDSPFALSVDGQRVALTGLAAATLADASTTPSNSMRAEADRERCVDVGLAERKLQVKYDPLNSAPALNAWTLTDGVVRGEALRFGAWSNYNVFIERAEIRLFVPGQSRESPPFASVPIAMGGSASWQPLAPGQLPNAVHYLLRVYDKQGRFDETALKQVVIVERRRAFDDLDKAEREALKGYGENSRERANIPVSGGSITVAGSLPGGSVRALGGQLPVDPAGRYAARQIVPYGTTSVDVELTDAAGRSERLHRNLDMRASDWFFTAVGDLTFGRNQVAGPAAAVSADSSHYTGDNYIDGRAAFYLKGRTQTGWLITSSMDTREQPLSDLFSNFSSKDPRYLLRRFDQDIYYPVYGDDSTILDDAPTQGKFYLKAERGGAQFLWGNFQTAWTGNELTQYSRGLYGLNALWQSPTATPWGETRTRLNAFAAEPGTVASREEFRGTGGSLYYLRHLDITRGSERVWVEVRDADSGFVIERKPLQPAQDYDLNYLQGRVLLRAPLSSTGDSGSFIRSGAVPGNALFLVVTYEYAPGLASLSGLSTGLRASHWLTDWLRIGMTSYRQGDDGADQTLKGVDITLRASAGTFVRMEAARSNGAGTAALGSIDGGFAFAQQSTPGNRADAQRVEAHADLQDFTSIVRGTIAAYYEHRDAGYSAPGQIAAFGEATTQHGAAASLLLDEVTSVDLKVDQRDATSQDMHAEQIALRRRLDEHWTLTLAARHDLRDTHNPALIASPLLAEQGSRTDVQARMDYRPDGSPPPQPLQPLPLDPAAGNTPWDVYGYLQGTAERSGSRSDNDRAGVGGSWQATQRLRLGGELSAGDGGPAGKLSGDWRVDDRSNYYLAYTQETERPDVAYRGRFGNLITGSRYRVSDRMSLFGETRLAHGTGPESFTQAYGVDLAPNDRWTTGFKFETGRVSDPLAGDLRRQAIGAAVAYKDGSTKYAGNLEFRHETGTTGNRNTWLARNSLGHQLDPAWRLLGKFNFSTSTSSQGDFFDGNFSELVLGAAYRPIDNDRWNTLVKYTRFYNLPSPGQVNATNTAVLDYAQKSQVFSLDTIWDATPWLSLGFKYGLRIGELKDRKVGGEWFQSRADLVAVRADWHFVKQWDAMLELRKLNAREAQDARAGALIAIYRHVEKHVKLGAGYNFTTYSDNLTDLSYRSRGWFINILSTY
ncbi:MAG: OmpA family protein [Rhodocyclaceae bacterium]|nr:OmpA family protein [Rhodocyclaceae bacterium]MBX3668350.1 OmpA family protein [Rhodocyclaceae bacterium]